MSYSFITILVYITDVQLFYSELLTDSALPSDFAPLTAMQGLTLVFNIFMAVFA